MELPKIMTNTLSDDVTYNPDKFPIAVSLLDFKTRFSIFTGGLLDGLDWTNIVCTGGAVLGTSNTNTPHQISRTC
jgi:TATA-box binding protein (TBP) (component of TFIID and TFIIIB)